MLDIERLIDKMSADSSSTESEKQFAIGFIAGKERARFEMLAVIVALYLFVALIGYIANHTG